MRRKAFTLIEILVCITIIMVLASLLFTTMREAIVRGNTTVCTSNLKQMHAAMTMYENDYGDYPPSNEDWPGLVTYLVHTKLRCPDSPGGRPQYFLHAHYDSGDNPLDKPCMSLRGPAYPVAHDFNHYLTSAAYRAQTRFILFIRMDGSVAQSRNKTLFQLTQSQPCPGASYWSNF